MIRTCAAADSEAMFEIINDAAQAYRGVIPADRYHEPYMSREELAQEVTQGVSFWGYEEGSELLGVMGLQDKGEVTLIRHAYVRTCVHRRGIGGKLLRFLLAQTSAPILIGTWAQATWAIRFYERYGFRLVTPEEKDRLLQRYWTIPDRQMETSVVLAAPSWFEAAD